MQSPIRVPKTIGKAKQRLAAITVDRRLSGWERAAIVWAHTHGHIGSPSGEPSRNDIAEALGLSPRTIDRARKAWKVAMEKHGAPDIKPDEVVPQSILDLDYPPTEETDDTGVTRDERGARAYIARNPQIVVEAVKAVPAVADAVVMAVADDPELTEKHARASFAHRPGTGFPKGLPKPNVPTIIPTYEREKELAKAITIVTEAIKDEQSGAWTPDAGSVAMLTILFLNLRDRADRYAAAQPAVHSEIGEFLANSRKAE